MSGRRCLVALCHNGPVVYTKTAASLMELGWGDRVQKAKDAHGFEAIDFMWFSNFPRVDAMRDNAADLAVRDGYSHILFLDADMLWPTNVLERMLRHHAAGIVGAIYFQRNPPFAPVALKDKFREDGSNVDQFYHAEIEGKDLIPVQVLGMGCTLVPVEVFTKIGPRPWFEYRNDDQGWPCVTEDVPLCLKAVEAGYAVSVDPTVECAHASIGWVDRRWWKRANDYRAETIERMPIKFEVRRDEQPQMQCVGDEVV